MVLTAATHAGNRARRPRRPRCRARMARGGGMEAQAQSRHRGMPRPPTKRRKDRMSASLVAPAVGPRAAALAAVTSRTRIAWFLRGGASGVDLYQPGCGDRSHFSFDRRANSPLDRSRATFSWRANNPASFSRRRRAKNPASFLFLLRSSFEFQHRNCSLLLVSPVQSLGLSVLCCVLLCLQ